MIVAAMGASLVAMVARISFENAAYAEHGSRLEAIVDRADRLVAECETARIADEDAYRRVVDAMALPKASPQEKTSRASALQAALFAAAEAPLHGAELAMQVLRLAGDSLAIRNRNLVSDLGCAAEFAASALAACAYNVRINHRFLKDAQSVERQARTLAGYERECAAFLEAVRREVNRELA